jgi:predicted HTH domain antitoxin
MAGTVNFNIEIPNSVFLALNENENELKAKMRVFSALEYYRQKKLSLGKASELADVSTARFIEILSEHEIPSIRYSPEQLDTELTIFGVE